MAVTRQAEPNDYPGHFPKDPRIFFEKIHYEYFDTSLWKCKRHDCRVFLGRAISPDQK